MATIMKICENKPQPMVVQWMLQLLVTVQLTTATVTAQVNLQPCIYNAAHTVANCSFQRLAFVPWHLHKNIITLDLTGNYFPTVANQSFISYSYINHLYLRNNSIRVIESMAFHMLHFLTMLDLANNKLMYIPASPMESIANTLLQLNLSGNKIQAISKGIFQHFVRLQLLDLSGNGIFKIEQNALKGLHSMQEFKIRHNALTSLPPDSFDDFPGTVKKIQLYDNRWFCDCKIRWLWQWLNRTSSKVWDSKGYNIRCDGPSLIREKALSLLSVDELACEVQMKTSSSTRELTTGANITLLCKYTSVPEVAAVWLKNSQAIDVNKHNLKYSVEASILELHPGEKTQQTELKIKDFSHKDIAKYVCYVQNIRGVGSTEYKLTLEGFDFDTLSPLSSKSHTPKTGVDTRSVVIAVGVVCSIILIIIIAILIFCSVNRMQRRQQEKQIAIVENVKQHFINNSNVTVSNGDITKLKDSSFSSKTEEKKQDKVSDKPATNHVTNYNTTNVERAHILDQTDPVYTFQQPESPFINGNTYVSFGNELTDLAEFPNTHSHSNHASSSRYECSQAGSSTPLLDRNTPSVFDCEGPIEDYAHYPVYDSLTNSIQHPYHEDIYRNRYITPNTTHCYDDSTKRLSSFYYPNKYPPSTPATTRSTRAMTPKYTDLAIKTSSRPDLYRATTQNNPDYRNYREMQYSTPPPHRVTLATKKSMSVGNLGFTPISAGPRKPPRIFQSREHMELTPHDFNNSTSPTAYSEDHCYNKSSPTAYPEAHRYSLNYGITPGTAV